MVTYTRKSKHANDISKSKNIITRKKDKKISLIQINKNSKTKLEFIEKILNSKNK